MPVTATAARSPDAPADDSPADHGRAPDNALNGALDGGALNGGAFNGDALDDGADPRTYVTFDLAAQTFAVDVHGVREILDLQPISHLPNAPPGVIGVTDVRGDAIAVIDLAGRLGMQLDPQGGEERIIVFELGAGDDPTPVGVIAERVLSVVEIAAAEIEATPGAPGAATGGAVRGITRLGGRLAMVLDLGAVFAVGGDARDPFDFS